MKKSRTSFFIVLLFLIITGLNQGCGKKFLSPQLLSAHSPESSFNTPKGLEAALTTTGRNLWTEYLGTDCPLLTQLYFSDVAVNGNTNSPEGKDFTGRFNADDAAMTAFGLKALWYWKTVFSGIKSANAIVTYIDLPHWDTTKQEDRKQRNALLGGAYFWRAYCYYYLVHCFGDVPWVGKLYKEPKFDFYSVKREVILSKLKKDLEFAALWVTDNGNKGTVTKGAVLHLLTKVNLALGNFDDAISTASQLIEGNVYSLMMQRFGVDKNNNSKNIVWDLHRPENKSIPENKEGLLLLINRREPLIGPANPNATISNAVPYWANNINTPNGNKGTSDRTGIEFDWNSLYGRGLGVLRPTWYSTHGIWINAGDDLRHSPGNWMNMEDLLYNNPAIKGTDSYYGKPLQQNSNSGLILVSDTINSWFSWPHYKLYVYDPDATLNQTGGCSDWYIYRLAETYLLRAEAYVWKGNTSNAASDINLIRSRAKAPPLQAAAITMATILDERARELFYEEPRKVELTRIAYLYAQTGQLAPTAKTYTLKDFSDNNFWYDWIQLKNNFYNKGIFTRLGIQYTISPHMALWPVPQSAIEANIKGVINQNPYYRGTEDNRPPLDQINDE